MNKFNCDSFLFTKIGIRKTYEFPKRKFVKPCGEQLIFEKNIIILPARALILLRSKSLEDEFPPSYSNS